MRQLEVIIISVSLWPVSGIAAPALPAEGPAAVTPAPQPDPELTKRYSELVERGEQNFELSDFNGALELWTAAYEMLPNAPAYNRDRMLMRRAIANTHQKAYSIDHDIQHLYKARNLLVTQLEELDAIDETGRTEAQAKLGEIVMSIEAAEREQELAAREQPAREQPAREPMPDRIAAEPEHRGDREDRKYRALSAIGWTAIGLGVASTGGMVAGLVLGERVDRQGQNVANDTSIPADEVLGRLIELRDSGQTYNRLAIGTGAAAGVLWVTGITLRYIVKNRYKDRSRTQVSPRLGGFALRF